MESDTPHLDNMQMIFQCPLCSSIPVHQRAEFLDDLQYSVKEYDKDDVIVIQGSVCETLYIVIDGEVSTEMSDEKGDFMEIEYKRELTKSYMCVKTDQDFLPFEKEILEWCEKNGLDLNSLMFMDRKSIIKKEWQVWFSMLLTNIMLKKK